MKWVRVGLVLAALSASAGAVENQAFWGMFAETSVQKNVGMPDMSEMFKDMDPETLKSLPPEVQAMMKGGPKRTFNIRVWSPNLAPEGATAVVLPPTGLNQGERLELQLYRPKPAQGTVEDGDEVELPEGWDPAKFTIYKYWGSSPTVKEGQPEVITWESIGADMKKEYADQARAQAMTEEGGEYFYKPNWTTAYWPTDKQPGLIEGEASVVGGFQVQTSYTGNETLEVPANVDFLAPINFTAPDLSAFPDLKQALHFQWEEIPNVIGYICRIHGMKGKEVFIQWSSSAIKRDGAPEYDYLQMADVRNMVQTGEMMAGDTTEFYVPAGIFDGCDMVFMTMTGYGPGAAKDEGQPIPRLQTRTVWSGSLGGKMMMQMGMGEE